MFIASVDILEMQHDSFQSWVAEIEKKLTVPVCVKCPSSYSQTTAGLLAEIRSSE